MKGKILKRVVAAALALLIVSGGAPIKPVADMFGDTAITANAEEAWSKSAANTVLGTTGIEHPQAPQEDVEWRGNYVYFGKYGGNPMKYRILDADSQEFVPRKPYPNNSELQDPTQKTMFLESDSRIGSWNFGGQRDWDSSVLKKYLVGEGNQFLNKEGVFTSQERSSIFNSVKLSKSTGEKADGSGYDYGSNEFNKLYYEGLWGDYIFVLDAVEATNPYYGYANTDKAHKSRDRGGYSWLRCTVIIYSQIGNYAGAVNTDGSISHYPNRNYLPICPAFNIDLNKVLFSSRISGDANAEYGKEYKLTLKNDNFGIGITSGDYVTYNTSNRWVSVPYTVTDNDNDIDPNTVSVLITDTDGKIVDYHAISDTYSAKGTAWFQLPTNNPQNYHVYLLAENRNGIHETDYASPMTEIHVPTTYGITYVLNGGTNNPANPSTYIDDYGTEICAPTRERYNFGGWYYDSAFSGEPVTNIPAGTTGRVKLYAKWIPCVYNVTLDKRGGTIVGEELTQYTYGVGATLPEITREHYTFKGWYVRDKYGNELKYTNISTSSYGDKSFYAKWSVNTYTIGYELNGGTVSPANPTTYNAENLPITLNNPTRTGYTFTGWTGTEIEGNSTSVEITDCSAGNRNYTANWSVNHYTVKFDKNNANASGTMADQNFTCNEEQTLTANGFTAPTGYHLAGWATTPGGNAVYTDEQSVMNMTENDNQVITLYAVWAANTYTIHFDKNSDLAYGEMPDQVFTYDAAAEKLSKKAFIFTTADFLGWATTPNGEVAYTDQQEVQNLTAVNNEVITLYAQWKREYGVFDNSENSNLFYFRVENGTQNSNWFFPGDEVQIYKTDFNNKYVINVKDADGKVIKTIDETQPGSLDYTFTMPDKNLYVTIGDTVITDIGNIAEISLDGKESWDDSAYLYNANNPTVTPTVTVECSGQILTEGDDYTLEIVNNTGSSDHMVEAAVIVTGKGRYCGTRTKTFRITPFNIADCELEGTLEAYNDGYGPYYPLGNNVEVWNGNKKLTFETDYLIELDPDLDIYDDYEVGEKYTATLKGCGDWGGSQEFEFTFVALSHTIVFDANGGTGTIPNAKVGNDPGRYYLPECSFTAPYGYEFDYWTADCEIDEDTGLPVHKQPGNYFSAPYIWSEYDVQTITVTAYWKEKAKYTVTLPENMELLSGIVDNDGKAYKDEVITFRAVDGCSVFGEVKVGDNVLTPDANGIYTVTVTADTAVTAAVIDNNTCYFDESTSTLHLRGNVNKTDVQKYKKTALSVVAEKGAVLPEDSFGLFEGFNQATSMNLANADTSNVTNMMYMFFNCKSLTTLDLSNFDTSSVTDMYGMFRSCEKLTSLDLSSFNTSSVKDMACMFCGCHALTSLDLGGFDTSSVTNMNSMFDNCESLTSLDLSGFDTSSVTDMGFMFFNCSALETLDLSGFDTSSVTNMSYMFYLCEKLTSLDLRSFNTGNVKNMEDMFCSCNSLTSLDLSSFDTSSVTAMTYMFWMSDSNPSNLTTIYVSESWNTDNVTSSDKMFENCTKLKGGNNTAYDSNNIDKTYAVIDGQDGQAGYLTGTYKLTLPENMAIVTDAGTDKKVGGRYLNGAVVTFSYTGTVPEHYYVDVKAGYTELTPDENGVYTLTVTENTSVSAEVKKCRYTVTLPKNMEFVGTDSEDYEYNTAVSFKPKDGYVVKGNVTANGTTLTADENGIYTLNVTENTTVSGNVDVESYFLNGTLYLKGTVLKNSGYGGSIILPNGVNESDVLHIVVDTDGATLPQDSSCLFYDFRNVQSIDLTRADTSNVTNMWGMFENCKSLTSLDSSSFDTSSVTNMDSMFSNCESLTSLDLSGFDTSSVTYMGFMFFNCSALETLDLSGFDTSSVASMYYMFLFCESLTSLDLSGFDTSSVASIYSEILPKK